MRKIAASMLSALILLAAGVIPFVPIEKAYSLLPTTETFTFTAQKDSFIKQGSQTHNEGASVILNIISSDKHRPIIAFDINAIGAAVDGRPLQSAILRLYVTENGNNWGPDGNMIGAHKVLEDWHEGNGWNLGNSVAGTGSGVTWGCAIDSDISNNQNDCATQWDGGSFQSTATGSALIMNNLVNQWVEFNVTSDVQVFLDGTEPNYGWLIKKASESLNGAVQFASKEAAANNPVLEITVTRPEAILANEYLALIGELDALGQSLNRTEVTPALVDDINSDLARIKQIVIELQNLGFDGEGAAAREGQRMVGTVRFADAETSELLFETQIPDGTIGIFAVMGMKEEFALEGVELTFEQLADTLGSSLRFAETIANFDDDEIASSFVLASIGRYHPSTGNTFTLIPIAIIIAFNLCLSNEICAELVQEAMQEGAKKATEFLFPFFTITGTKFNDVDGDGHRDDPIAEPGLEGWTFTAATFNSPLTFKTNSSSSGFFSITGRVPASTEVIVVFETLKDGWESTNGEIREIPFVHPGVSGPFQDPLVFEPVALSFGNRLIAPAAVFEENFDGGLSGWSQTLCQRGSGQDCFITTRTDPAPVPSPPNWGASGLVDTVPGCGSSVASRHSKSFTVQTSGNYEIQAVMFGSTCSGCTVTARLFVDNQQIFAKPGQRLGVTPPQPPASFSAVVPLTAGQHSIQIGMTSTLACSGTFQGEFDNISIKPASNVQTLQSQSGPLPGGPYYRIELNQISVNATAPDTATVRLKVHWDLGYEPEPVSVAIMANTTSAGISHTITSAYNTTSYQVFDITFGFSPEVQVGQYEYLVFVNDEDSGDSLAEAILLNVE